MKRSLYYFLESQKIVIVGRGWDLNYLHNVK